MARGWIRETEYSSLKYLLKNFICLFGTGIKVCPVSIFFYGLTITHSY